MREIDPNRQREVVSVTTTPRGQMEDFVLIACPEKQCDWHTGDWSVKYEDEARSKYEFHWRANHAPTPPAPLEDRWTG